MRTYSEDLVSKSDSSHGCWRVLLDKADENSLVDGVEADATLALGIFAQHHFPDSCNVTETNNF